MTQFSIRNMSPAAADIINGECKANLKRLDAVRPLKGNSRTLYNEVADCFRLIC